MAKCLVLSALLVLSAAVCCVKAGGMECTTCKVLIGQVEAWLASNATETWIEDELRKVCAILPNDVQFLCNEMVAQLPAVITSLENKETPTVVCTSILKMCSGAKINSVLVCDACEFLLWVIEGWVESNKTLSEITQLLDDLCSYLPNVLAATCERVVQVGLEDIIAWINANESPDQICAQIGLCPSLPVIPEEPVGTWECDVCTFLFSSIEGWLLDNKTVSEIEELLDELCSLLGSTVEPVCDMIVKIGVEDIVVWIEQNETPEEICTQLLLCSAAPKLVVPEAENDFLCSTCVVVMEVLEDFVESNKTEQELEAFIDQLCAILPSIFEEFCDLLVDDVIHKVYEWLNNNEPPDVICQQLGLCDSIHVPFHPFPIVAPAIPH